MVRIPLHEIANFDRSGPAGAPQDASQLQVDRLRRLAWGTRLFCGCVSMIPSLPAPGSEAWQLPSSGAAPVAANFLQLASVRRYAGAMSLRLLRLVVVAITICAFIGAGLMQNLTLSANTAAVGTTMMADQGGEDGASMSCHNKSAPPCRDQVPSCMTDLGCVFAVALPAWPVRATERLVWDSVTYWSLIRLTEGISPEPAVEPPIRLV